MKEIPKKNYVIVLVIILLTVVVTFFLMNLYKSKTQKTSEIYTYLSEIKENEFDSYLFENPSVIIYFADKYNLENSEKEIKIKEKINDLNVYNYFIYLDTNDIDEEFLDNFSKKYNFKLNISDAPLFIVINEGKVIEIFKQLEDANIEKMVEDVK